MSNEELLGRIDERLTAASKQLESIHLQTTSIDKRLRDVENGVESLKNEIAELPKLKERLEVVVAWKDKMSGSWKAVVVISVILSFILNSIIQAFSGGK